MQRLWFWLLVSLPLLAHGAPQCVVRSTPGRVIATGSCDCEATELWLEDKDTGKRELLVRGSSSDDPKRVIAAIESPVLSPDLSAVYFISAAWAVSGAVHKVDVRSKKVSFLIDGHSFAVIQSGPLIGSLLVERAIIKFDRNGESLGRDCYLWLVSMDGRPIRELGIAGDPAVETERRALLGENEKRPNQTPEPTPPSVTPRADARVAPAGVVAHL